MPNESILVPHLTVIGASDAIAFYEKAFGAKEIFRMEAPGGKLMHANINIHGATVYLNDDFPGNPIQSPLTLGGNSIRLQLNVADTDAAYGQAVGAGAKGMMEPTNMPWGARYAVVNDPFGHTWSLSAQVEQISLEEAGKRMMEDYQARTKKAD